MRTRGLVYRPLRTDTIHHPSVTPAEPGGGLFLQRAVALARHNVAVGGAFAEPLEARRLLSVALLSDTNPAANAGTASGAFVFDYDGSLYFTADDGTHGVELYKSNGTPGSATMLKDINPGGSSFPMSFCVVNGIMYFTADDGTHSRELWQTNGTPDGTFMVADISTSTSAIAAPVSLVALGDLLIFSEDDGTHGREMWTYDGNNLNLIDIRPNTTAQSLYTPFTVFNNRVYFAANDGSGTGVELWSSDGTPGGTGMVYDINANTNNIFGPSNLTVCNNTLYFTERTVADGNEPWMYDGIQGHIPTEVMNINPTSSSNPSGYTAYNGKVYFSADDGTHGAELWETDGTPGNAQLVKDINTQTVGSNASAPTGLFVYNGFLYFDADDGRTGPELYQSDGTPGGTNLFKEINPAFFNGSGFILPTVLNGIMYFISNGGSSVGTELWRSDGTATGTFMVRDIAPGSASSFNTNSVSMRAFSGAIYFYANDQTHGNEVWKLAPPTVNTTGFDVNTPAVTVTFAEPVNVDTTAANYPIVSLTTGETRPVSVSYDSATRTATFTLPSDLPDAEYTMAVSPNAITDAYGNPMAAFYEAGFFILTGDADHNGVVDTTDFMLLSQNFGQPGATYAKGDFNRDGTINALDFNALATNFGSHVTGAMIPTPNLFSDRDIDPTQPVEPLPE